MSGTGWTCNVGTLTCTRRGRAGRRYQLSADHAHGQRRADGAELPEQHPRGERGRRHEPGQQLGDRITGLEAAPTPTLGTWAFLFLAVVLAQIAARALRVRRTF